MTAGAVLHASPAASKEIADRFAAFALGCLGSSTPSKAGSQLGIMGNVSEVELREVLFHLEALAKQRAAKQAGYPGDENPSRSSPSRPKAAEAPVVCSAEFKRALSEACGVDADCIHLLLPRDAAGKVDLMGIFRMSSPTSVPVLGDEAHCREYVDHAKDLPATCADWQAVCHLEEEVRESSWSEDTGRINKLRAAIAHGDGSHGSREVSSDLLVAVSRRCGSRRPALGKTALRALQELCHHPGAAEASAWAARGSELLRCVSAAVLVTKVTARLCDETLDAILRRLLESSPAGALEAVTAATRHQVEAGHPTAVVALLRVAKASLRSAAGQPGEQAMQASAAASASAAVSLLQDILENRRFAMAFSEARALLRQLQTESQT